jgi:hypothetical protein
MYVDILVAHDFQNIEGQENGQPARDLREGDEEKR